MATMERKLVHKQFNSPIGLYSQDNVKETVNRELKAFGSAGIEVDDQNSRPLNLASSAVLRAVEEEDQMKCGYKRVAWPPTSEERIVREFTPQPQTQYQPAPAYNQQYQPSAAAPTTAVPSTQQQYRAPSYENYQQAQPHQQPLQQQQYPPQSQHQAQAQQQAPNLYQQPPQAGSSYQQPNQQSAWAPQQRVQQQQQQQYPQPPWVQQPQQPLYQQQQQPQYQNSLNQYNQAPHHQQQQQYPLQQNQFLPQINQQQFNSYSQPQQQQHTVSHDQVDQQQHHQPHLPQDQQRGASPGIITLRKEVPITQQPAPVYTSQPAAVSFRESSTDSLGGSNMRGDLKWPPPEYKEAAVKENEERRKLALGPVCRPRKVNRDYTSFFAKNALSHHYPSYKVPPGTQHMIN